MNAAADLQARFFVNENTLPLGKALAAVRTDVIHPGHRRCPITLGTKDVRWLPYVGEEGLLLITRDNMIRCRAVEKQIFLASEVEGLFLTKSGSMSRWDMLRMVVQHWGKIEPLVEEKGPFFYSLTQAGVRKLTLPVPQDLRGQEDES